MLSAAPAWPVGPLMPLRPQRSVAYNTAESVPLLQK
jgi:hypothetical protein